MIQTIISNAKNPEYGQATVFFPIKEDDYPNVVELLRSMGLGNPLERDCRVDEVCGDWPILKRLEKVAINLDEMDYLARRLTQKTPVCAGWCIRCRDAADTAGCLLANAVGDPDVLPV